jgi:hypothetical protein
VPGAIAWCDPETDIAAVGFDPPDAVPVAAAGFGRLADRHAVIEVHTAGFPRWKLRRRADGRQYRDLHDAAGILTVLSNRRSGTLEITVNPPGEDPDPGVSPWEAMSGAAVFAGPHIIGVVAEHHRREGLGRLTAVRIDRCLDRTDQRTGQTLAEVLGIVDAGALPDVVPTPSGWLTRSGYLEQVREIAPTRGLIGREAELAELTAFCAGDEPYVWWRAGPWAGKTALMSTFVLNPPAGVEVVSFFITARLAAQADSNAFTDALLDQLSVVVGNVPTPLTPTARDAHRRELLRAAVDKTAATGRRLVLVVRGQPGRPGTLTFPGHDIVPAHGR